MKKLVILLAMVGFLAVSLSSCTKTKVKPMPEPEPQADTTPPPPPPPPPLPPPPPPAPVEPTINEVIQIIYFDYDSYEINSESEGALKTIAQYLEKHSDINLTIEGNCDERGTQSYNQALGQKRADAVKNYFKSYGLDATRFRTVSYGELKPAVEGDDESAWKMNRRCEFRP